VLLGWENEGVYAYSPSQPRSTFLVRNLTSWSADLTVETDGRDVINQAGTAALRLIADRTGLTAGLSGALARRGFTPVHDRGRALADTANDQGQRRAHHPRLGSSTILTTIEPTPTESTSGHAALLTNKGHNKLAVWTKSGHL
jgi:hypothetical protein